MPEHLYRFRSIRALLDDHHELENQEIYFCPPPELNDPLEGFKDIVWQGDDIVWRNLLRHYVLSLVQATSLATILGPEFTPKACSTIVQKTDDDLPQAPIRDICVSACGRFLEHDAPQDLVAALSSQLRAVRRDELIFYLSSLHPLAISSVLTAFGQHGLVLVPSMSTLDNIANDMANSLKDVVRHVYSVGEETSGLLFSASQNLASQLRLASEINNPFANNLGWLFVARDFPSYYVNAIERLLYPDWHAACFVANPTNASMWGAYGDAHCGVCLKFDTRPDKEGFRSLNLGRRGQSGQEDFVAHYDYVAHRFEEVRYTAEFPQIHFFESLGTMPRFKLTGFWYAGPNGEISAVASKILEKEEKWRQEYWRKFVVSYSTKTPEWSHEQEYRLILYSNLERFDDPASRKFKYRFADLAGVVFDIKTSTEDKIRIMRIIERKCIAKARRDFEFYQAPLLQQSEKNRVGTIESA